MITCQRCRKPIAFETMGRTTCDQCAALTVTISPEAQQVINDQQTPTTPGGPFGGFYRQMRAFHAQDVQELEAAERRLDTMPTVDELVGKLLETDPDPDLVQYLPAGSWNTLVQAMRDIEAARVIHRQRQQHIQDAINEAQALGCGVLVILKPFEVRASRKVPKDQALVIKGSKP